MKKVNLVRYKARLVAKGFMHVEGIDFGVYTLVCTHPTRRTLFAIAAKEVALAPS